MSLITFPLVTPEYPIKNLEGKYVGSLQVDGIVGYMDHHAHEKLEFKLYHDFEKGYGRLENDWLCLVFPLDPTILFASWRLFGQEFEQANMQLKIVDSRTRILIWLTHKPKSRGKLALQKINMGMDEDEAIVSIPVSFEWEFSKRLLLEGSERIVNWAYRFKPKTENQTKETVDVKTAK